MYMYLFLSLYIYIYIYMIYIYIYIYIYIHLNKYTRDPKIGSQNGPQERQEAGVRRSKKPWNL